MDKPSICFAIVCYNFERRLAWQLSSLVQQIDAPGMLIHIATMVSNADKESNKPSRAQVVVDWILPKGNHHAFVHEYSANESDFFAYRSMVRNDQINFAKSRNYKWIYFADCDMIYHPEFFSNLAHFLNNEGKDVEKCIYSRNKWSTELKSTEELIENIMREKSFVGCYVPDAYSLVKDMPHKINTKTRKNVAWGGMQVVRLDAIDQKCEGRYSARPDSCGDSHLFRAGQMARGDRGFRSKMGQTFYELPPQIHMEHVRDKELRYHTEEQR